MTDENNIDPTSDSNLPPPPITASPLSITRLDMEQWLVLPTTRYFLDELVIRFSKNLAIAAKRQADKPEPNLILIQKFLVQSDMFDSLEVTIQSAVKSMSVNK